MFGALKGHKFLLRQHQRPSSVKIWRIGDSFNRFSISGRPEEPGHESWSGGHHIRDTWARSSFQGRLYIHVYLTTWPCSYWAGHTLARRKRLNHTDETFADKSGPPGREIAVSSFLPFDYTAIACQTGYNASRRTTAPKEDRPRWASELASWARVRTRARGWQLWRQAGCAIATWHMKVTARVVLYIAGSRGRRSIRMKVFDVPQPLLREKSLG